MGEFILFAFVFLTALVIVLAYWPRPAQTPSRLSSSSRQASRAGPGERRVALVIGNGAYPADGRLPNPVNDAAAVAGALSRLGFEVFEQHDLGVRQMQRVL